MTYVLLTVFSVCGMSTVADLSIVSGPRGVAVSIISDCAYSTHLERKNGSSVCIFLEGCTYENAVNYDRFASDAAIRSIFFKKKKNGIELTINLRVTTDSIIRSHLKGNAWMALLSSKPSNPLKWSISELMPEYRGKKGEHLAENSNSIPNNLKNIRLFSRDNTCELFFDFNTAPLCDIKRNKDTLYVRFNDAASAIESSFFVLPQGTVFKNIKLDIIKSGGKQHLVARVILNRDVTDSTFNILSKSGPGLSLYATIKHERKAVLWNSLSGLEMGYDFYKMPVYEVDMRSLERQIRKDSSMTLTHNLLFSIQERKKEDMSAVNSVRPLESVVQKEDIQDNSYSSAGIKTMQQSGTDSVTSLRVNIGSEIPVALDGLSKAELTDTVMDGNYKKMIRYNRNGRDPFLPYISSVESDLGLPFLENLHLVGILFDNKDRIALLEDKKNKNRPFTMREEDRVEKGKLIKIYRDRIVFLITEYGISRSVTLRLTDISTHQEVGIR